MAYWPRAVVFPVNLPQLTLKGFKISQKLFLLLEINTSRDVLNLSQLVNKVEMQIVVYICKQNTTNNASNL